LDVAHKLSLETCLQYEVSNSANVERQGVVDTRVDESAYFDLKTEIFADYYFSLLFAHNFEVQKRMIDVGHTRQSEVVISLYAYPESHPKQAYEGKRYSQLDRDFFTFW
jgi:hypothetical protein